MKMKKTALASSVATIALCSTLIAGSTFALFTSQDKVNVAVTAGQVALTANLVDNSLLTWSLYETEADARTDGTFVNGGTAKITDEANVKIDLMTPGDVVKFTIDVENASNVHTQYRVRMVSTNSDPNVVDLTPALKTTAIIEGVEYAVTGSENATLWKYVEANKAIDDITVYVEFPNTDDSFGPENKDNAYQNGHADITFIVEAVQSNAKIVAADEASLQEALLNGAVAVSGNGATVNTEGLDLNKKDAALEDVTIVAQGGAGYGIGYYQGEKLTLGAGATIQANNSYGILVVQNGGDIVLNQGSKIVNTQSGGACIGVMPYPNQEVNIYLNDVDLLEGDIGIYILGAMAGSKVNLHFPNEEVMNHYVGKVKKENNFIGVNDPYVSWIIG